MEYPLSSGHGAELIYSTTEYLITNLSKAEGTPLKSHYVTCNNMLAILILNILKSYQRRDGRSGICRYIWNIGGWNCCKVISRLFRKVKREKPGRFYIQPAYTQAAAEFLVGTVKSSHAEQCDAAHMVSVLKAVTVILTVGTMANFVCI